MSAIDTKNNASDGITRVCTDEAHRLVMGYAGARKIINAHGHPDRANALIKSTNALAAIDAYAERHDGSGAATSSPVRTETNEAHELLMRVGLQLWIFKERSVHREPPWPYFKEEQEEILAYFENHKPGTK